MTSERDREGASAIIELSLLGTLVLGTLVQVIVLFGTLHRATLATSAAAREAGRAAVLADTSTDADARAGAVVEQAGVNHGLEAESLRLELEGSFARGATLEVRVETDVAVVRLPMLGDVWPSLAVPVESTHVVQIDRYRSFTRDHEGDP